MTTSASPLPQVEARATVPAGYIARAWYTLNNALIITRREVRDSFRDWRIVAPIVILTFLFPFLSQFIAVQFQDYLAGFGADLSIISDRTTPFLLMVVGFFPISISLVIALETFVGEKERRSLEPLLSTPLSNTELYVGKALAAMIPPLIASLVGMGFYLLLTLSGELEWRPQPMLIFQIIVLTIMQALVMVTGSVVVSSQTTSTRAANLLASFIIIPMSFIVIGVSVIMFLAPDAESPRGIGVLWALIVGMFVVAVLLLRVGNSIFNREELLSSTIDDLNFRGFLAKIWRYIIAVDDDGTPARNVFDWYRRSIPHGLKRIRVALLIAVVIFSGAFGVGAALSQTPGWTIDLPSQDELIAEVGGYETARSIMSEALGTDLLSFDFIFWQNVRVLAAAIFLSAFTFGVASMALLPITFGALGYITALMLTSGYDPMLLIVGIGTHGIIEIPVILIAGATALAFGASVTKPMPGKTVGHSWLVMFGVTIRLVIGLILPGLIIAALIEANITPRLIVQLLGA